MKKKRILSTLLAVSLLSTMFAGCGQTQEEAVENSTVSSVASEAASTAESSTAVSSTEAESNTENEEYSTPRISEETITITVEGPSGAVAKDWTNTLQFQEYEKRMGLRFEATTYTNEQWDSRLTLMMAGDEMPDALFTAGKMNRSQVKKYADDGYLMDFSQYLDVMPNVKRLLEENDDYRAMTVFDDGGIYGFPRINVSAMEPCASYLYTFINQKWLDNLNLERPKTLDELYDVLVAFRDQDANGNGDPNDEIPLGFGKDAYDQFFPIMWSFGIDISSSWYQHRIDENGKLGIWDTTDNYKEYLRFLNKLYDEGLINEDGFVLEKAELDALINENKVGYFYSYSFDTSKDLTKDLYCVVGFTQEEYGGKSIGVLGDVVSDAFHVVVNADCEYGEEMAKFIDYLHTPEGQLSARNGYPGVTFDFNEAIPGYGTPDGSAYAEKYGYESSGKFRTEKGVALDACIPYVESTGTIYNMLVHATIEQIRSDAVWKKVTINGLREICARENPDTEFIGRFPILIYTDEETSERGTLYTDVSSYMETAFAQFVTGELDVDKDWDNHLKKLDDMGLQRLLEIDQAAYDRRQK